MRTTFIHCDTIYNTVFDDLALLQMRDYGLTEEMMAEIVKSSIDDILSINQNEEFLLEGDCFSYVCIRSQNRIAVEKIIPSENVL